MNYCVQKPADNRTQNEEKYVTGNFGDTEEHNKLGVLCDKSEEAAKLIAS